MNRDRVFLSLYIIAWMPLGICVIAKGLLLIIEKYPDFSIVPSFLCILATFLVIEIPAHLHFFHFYKKIEEDNSGQFFILKEFSEDKGRPLEYFASNILPFVTFDFFKLTDFFIFLILFILISVIVYRSKIIIPSLSTNLFGFKVYDVVVIDTHGIERSYRALSRKSLIQQVNNRIIAPLLSNEYLYIK